MDDPGAHPAFLAARAAYPRLFTQAVAFVLPLDAGASVSEDWVKSHLLAGERGAAELQPLAEELPPVRVAGGKLHVTGRTVPIRLEEHFYADQVALAILVIDGTSLWLEGSASASAAAPVLVSPRPLGGSDVELLLSEEEARDALGAASARAVVSAAAAELQRSAPSAANLARFVAALVPRLKVRAALTPHVAVLALAALYPTWFPLLCAAHAAADQRMHELLGVACAVQLADVGWDEPESEARWEAAVEEAAARLQATEAGRTPHDRLRALHAAATALTAHAAKHALRLTPERLLLLCTIALARAQLPHWHSTLAYVGTLHPCAALLASSGPGYHLATFQAAAEHLRAEDGFRSLLAARRTRALRSSLLPAQPARRGTASKAPPVAAAGAAPGPPAAVVFREPPRVISLDDDADYGDFLSNLRSHP